jgi:hypothetical protein
MGIAAELTCALDSVNPIEAVVLDSAGLPVRRGDSPVAEGRGGAMQGDGFSRAPRAVWRWLERASVAAVIPPLLILCLTMYLANGRVFGTGDTVPARYLPLSLLQSGNLDLDEFPELRASGVPYYMTYARGHYVSVYPVTAAIVALPVYLPLAFLDADRATACLPAAEKLAAAAIAALSVAFMWLALNAATSRRVALLLTVVYAFGTSTFSTTSQALWQHGAGQLGLAIMLWGLVQQARTRNSAIDAAPPKGVSAALGSPVRRASAGSGSTLMHASAAASPSTESTRGSGAAWWPLLAGLGAALACAARPTNALLAFSGLASLLLPTGKHEAGRWRAPLIAGLGLLPALVWHVSYNQWAFGDPWHLQWAVGDASPWQGDMITGFFGLLVSPSRGLFVYSPALLAAIPAIVTVRGSALKPLVRMLSVGVLLTIVLYAHWGMWWGGVSYGPRIIADVAPPMILLLVPSIERLVRGSWMTTVWMLAVVWSIGLHAIGAFCGNLGWNVRRDVDRHPERLWSWTDNQPVECGCVLIGAAPIPPPLP